MSYASINRGSFGGDRFTIVANAAIRDERLSYKARGLLALIASHREGWGVTETQLAEKSPDGISAVRSGLKELEKAGYLRRYRVRNELGHLGGAHWVITDDPTSLDARVADLAQDLDGNDLVPLQMLRSEPKCDFPNLADPTVGEPTEADRTPKNTNTKNTSTKKKGKGEEGAQPRASEPPVDNPVDNSDDGWGIAPTERPTPEQGTLFARTVVTQIAEDTGLGLEPWQHRRLVLEHLPAALDAVKALGDPAVSGTELVEWLRADHDTTMSLYAILSRRCTPDYLREALPVWVARTRTPGGLPAPAKPAAPRPRRERDAAPAPDPEPFTPGWKPPRTCRVHPDVTLTPDTTGALTRCRACEAPNAPEPAPVADVPAPDPADLADVIADAMTADPEPDMPDHCGARECHQHRRHIIRFNPATGAHDDLGPCPRCHPDHAQEDAA
ncbi:helix-turn-helix domain-containing protein [Nocardiopsis synnemataformans]|uniref:helix-turn-helix domain-containing protein n=1 Tax=Nocardiopsis synnemataformans TaxID=61305 RepID=UPI003EC078D4